MSTFEFALMSEELKNEITQWQKFVLQYYVSWGRWQHAMLTQVSLYNTWLDKPRSESTWFKSAPTPRPILSYVGQLLSSVVGMEGYIRFPWGSVSVTTCPAMTGSETTYPGFPLRWNVLPSPTWNENLAWNTSSMHQVKESEGFNHMTVQRHPSIFYVKVSQACSAHGGTTTLTTA